MRLLYDFVVENSRLIPDFGKWNYWDVPWFSLTKWDYPSARDNFEQEHKMFENHVFFWNVKAEPPRCAGYDTHYTLIYSVLLFYLPVTMRQPSGITSVRELHISVLSKDRKCYQYYNRVSSWNLGEARASRASHTLRRLCTFPPKYPKSCLNNSFEKFIWILELWTVLGVVR